MKTSWLPLFPLSLTYIELSRAYAAATVESSLILMEMALCAVELAKLEQLLSAAISTRLLLALLLPVLPPVDVA